MRVPEWLSALFQVPRYSWLTLMGHTERIALVAEFITPDAALERTGGVTELNCISLSVSQGERAMQRETKSKNEEVDRQRK